jgi:hypothetical protein
LAGEGQGGIGVKIVVVKLRDRPRAVLNVIEIVLPEHPKSAKIHVGSGFI